MKLFEFVKLSLNPDQRTPLAPDGLHVAVQRADQGRAAVWMLDSNREAATRFTFARDNMQVAPLFSADGRRVLFTSSSQALGALAGIYEKAASGGGTERLVFESAQYKALTDWSSDGRVVLYTAVNEKTGGDVWALPLTGDRKPFPVVQTSFDERNGQFAPNGQWI